MKTFTGDEAKYIAEVLDGEADEPTGVFPVEVHPAVRDGLYAWSVTLRTLGPKLVRFKPAKAGGEFFKVNCR